MGEAGRAERLGRVLVVDDDVAVVRVLAALIQQAGHEAEVAESAGEALEKLAATGIDVVISDVRMPGVDGLSLLSEVSGQWPDVPVVMLTAFATIPMAVDAMRQGAYDFLTKPFDRDEILFTLGKALAASNHRQAQLPRHSKGVRVLGRSPAMAEVERLIARAAATDATVLLRGETGTGKELVARSIHSASARSAGPFVPIHCGALPDALLESELFGYERGAFTGASSTKPGRVELARGGTLFLDEIGDVTPAFQVKLLRFLEQRRFERLGSTESRHVDVRIVAATHRDLERMVRAGEFRQDLYFRLQVVPLVLPPLRERSGDVEVLAQHLLANLQSHHKRSGIRFTSAALKRLAMESWPGNVRQLENFVERLVVLGDEKELDVVSVERELARDAALAPSASHAEPGDRRASAPPEARLEDARDQAEHAALFEALKAAGNNRTLAARLLGISRRTLYNKLERHGLL